MRLPLFTQVSSLLALPVYLILILTTTTVVVGADDSNGSPTTTTATSPVTSTDDPVIPLLSHPSLRNTLQAAIRILSSELQGVKLPAKGTPGDLLQSLSKQNVDPAHIAKRFLTQDDIRITLPKPEAVNQRCYDDVVDFIDALIGERQNASSKEYVSTDWAIKMVDSFGKPAPALLRGALHWTGNYEQCLDVHADIPVGTLLGSRPGPRSTSSHFDGHYCRVQIIIQLPTDSTEDGLWAEVARRPSSLHWGTCFPESCRGDDVKRLLTEGTMSANTMNVSHVLCYEKDHDLGSDGWAIFTICLYAVVGGIAILCTAFESIVHIGYLPWVKDQDQEDPKVGTFQKFGHAEGSATTDGDVAGDHEAVNGYDGLPGGGDGGKPASGAPNMRTPLSVDRRPKDVLGIDGSVPPRQDDQPDANNKGQRIEVGIGMRLLQAFSLRYNVGKLLSTSQESGPDVLSCIQGLRVISILLVILGHTYLLGGAAEPNNILFTPLDEYQQVISRLSFMLVRSGVHAVDTFFIISGLLVMKITLRLLRETEGHRLRFWIMFHVHRVWRITPVYMVVLVTGTHLYDHIVEGPLKADPSVMFGNCPDKWWHNILYINNFFDPHKMCMGWSWFLSVDMQLFFTAPIFIYLVYKKRRIGLIVLIATVVIGTIATFFIVLDNPGTFITSFLLGMEDYTKHVYLSYWPRLPVYALGLLAGVVLEDKLAENYKISKPKAFCIWVVFLALAVFFMLIPHDQVKDEGDTWSKGVAALYEASSHLVWGLFIVWVIYACQSGLGGIVNSILSWSAFQPLARLTFTVYLVHPLVSTFFLNSRHYPVDLQDTVMIYMFCGNVVLSYLFAIFITLMFESPLVALEKIALER